MAIGGKWVNLPYGTELEVIAGCIDTPEGMAVCYSTSEDAKRHFACNDDGRGLERGALSWAIAYARRPRQFTEAQIDLLERDWSQFLRKDVDTILFNEAFFVAPPEQLQQLAAALHIKTGRS